MASASDRLIPEGFAPLDTAERLQYAILLELRALNARPAAPPVAPAPPPKQPLPVPTRKK